MTAHTLFSKPKTPPGPVLVRPQSDLDRIAVWIARGRQERFLVETMVSPEMASALLHGNIDNRLLSIPTVETYAAAMRRGEWHLNGQNIIIADSGELNDGQTRLHAVIGADMPVMMGLQFGVTRDSRATLDVGRKRSLADHFAMAQVPNATALAAIVRLAWCYDSGIHSLTTSPTVEQAMAYIRRHPHVGDYAHKAKEVGSEFKASGAQLAFAAFVCGRVNSSVTTELLNRTRDGLGLSSPGVPASRVRDRFMAHLSGRALLSRFEAAAVFIKAFNAQHGGRKVRALSWTASGADAEPFPIAGT